MAKFEVDRNLLFGVLALQMDFVDRDALISAMHAWVLEKTKPLGQILVEQTALDAADVAMLDSVVDRHLQLHDNNPEQSLAAIATVANVRQQLQPIDDADVQATLLQISVAPLESANLEATKAQVASESADGRYQVLRPHAQGGLGVVHVAKDGELNREVALKEINQNLVESSETRARFVQEAEITARLEHPGIVPVYGMGKYQDGRPYYAMQLVKGSSLKEAIAKFHSLAPGNNRNRTLTLRQLLGRFVAVCNTIEYAHSRGILHRDIKPSNILLGKYGETLVVDWGLAKVLGERVVEADEAELTLIPQSGSGSSETLPGSAIGTPAYMSPEQAAGRVDQLTAASDIYSLGATLYALLTGKEPFNSKELATVLSKVQSGDFIPPRECNCNVPAALAAICMKAMSLQPQHRYASCTALAADIEHWLANEPVSAFKDPLTVRAGRWIKRHQALTASAAVLMIALLVGLIVGTAFLSRANRRIETYAAETEREREEATKQLYVSKMNLAQRAWNDNNVGRTRELLESQLPKHTGGEDLRGWEWHYLWRLTHSELKKFEFQALCLVVTPDGKYLASGSESGVLKIWTMDGFQVAHEIQAHEKRIDQLTFSGDGTRLATRSRDGKVKIWECATGREILSIPVSTRPAGIALSENGGILAAVLLDGDRLVYQIAAWSVPDGKQFTAIDVNQHHIKGLAFLPEDKQIVSGSWDGTIGIWNLDDGRRAKTFRGPGGQISTFAIDPDAQQLVCGDRNGRIKSLDLQTGRTLFAFEGHTNGVNSVSYHPGSSQIASCSDDATVKLWDANNGRFIQTLKGHESTVTSVAFAVSGDLLISGAWDGSIRVWDSASRQDPWQLRLPGGVRSVACAPDGETFIAGTAVVVVAFDAATGNQIWSQSEKLTSWISGTPNALRFSPDSRYVVCGRTDGKISFRNAADGSLSHSWDAHKGAVTAIRFSRDGKYLASCGSDGIAVVWDVATGKQLAQFAGHSHGINNVAFSPNGRLLATAGAEGDNTVKLWDIEAGRELRTLAGQEGAVFGLEFGSKGKLIFIGGRDEIIYVCDVATGRRVHAQKGHAGDVSSLSLSPDGRRLASASNDLTVKIWDVDTGQELLTFKPDAGEYHTISFSDDGLRLFTGAGDGTVTVWDARPLTPGLRSKLNKSDFYAEPLAQALVNTLFSTKLLAEDVVVALEADRTISDAVRRRALKIARRHRENPSQLNNRSWSLALGRESTSDDYQLAVKYAQRANDLEPENGMYLNTLGVAQYRLGDFETAAKTLGRSEELNTKQFRGAVPADIAFLAMSHSRLGHEQQAKDYLKLLEGLLEKDRWKDDAESQQFLKEAKELIKSLPVMEDSDSTNSDTTGLNEEN